MVDEIFSNEMQDDRSRYLHYLVEEIARYAARSNEKVVFWLQKSLLVMEGHLGLAVGKRQESS